MYEYIIYGTVSQKYLTIKYNTLIVLKSYFDETYVVIFYKSKI